MSTLGPCNMRRDRLNAQLRQLGAFSLGTAVSEPWVKHCGSAVYQCPDPGLLLGLSGHGKTIMCFACYQNFSTDSLTQHVWMHKKQEGNYFCVTCNIAVAKPQEHKQTLMHMHAIKVLREHDVSGMFCARHATHQCKSKGCEELAPMKELTHLRRLQNSLSLEHQHSYCISLCESYTAQKVSPKHMLSYSEAVLLALTRNLPTRGLSLSRYTYAYDPLAQHASATALAQERCLDSNGETMVVETPEKHLEDLQVTTAYVTTIRRKSGLAF